MGHFQQDDARPHTARVSQDCLCTVSTLPWPDRSPDLSPIKNIWDHLRRLVGHPASLNELESRLQQIWYEMSQDIIQNLYAPMPNLITLCVRARGGSTRSSCTKEKANIGLQDLISIPHSSHSASFKVITLCAYISKPSSLRNCND
ncbi:transposable element Tcb1 transposase [Trichonephila clavipes]|nr:transposable element Tcb1 transposase [Trichonephila clavipes]